MKLDFLLVEKCIMKMNYHNDVHSKLKRNICNMKPVNKSITYFSVVCYQFPSFRFCYYDLPTWHLSFIML